MKTLTEVRTLVEDIERDWQNGAKARFRGEIDRIALIVGQDDRPGRHVELNQLDQILLGVLYIGLTRHNGGLSRAAEMVTCSHVTMSHLFD